MSIHQVVSTGSTIGIQQDPSPESTKICYWDEKRSTTYIHQSPQILSTRIHNFDPPGSTPWIHQEPPHASSRIHNLARTPHVEPHPALLYTRINHWYPPGYLWYPPGSTTQVDQNPSLRSTRIWHWDTQGPTSWIYHVACGYIRNNHGVSPRSTNLIHKVQPLDPPESITLIHQVDSPGSLMVVIHWDPA